MWTAGVSIARCDYEFDRVGSPVPGMCQAVDRTGSRRDLMTMKCPDCQYGSVCFPLLRAAVSFGYVCKQGRMIPKRKGKQQPGSPGVQP
jgi:hypothetical protein